MARASYDFSWTRPHLDEQRASRLRLTMRASPPMTAACTFIRPLLHGRAPRRPIAAAPAFAVQAPRVTPASGTTRALAERRRPAEGEPCLAATVDLCECLPAASRPQLPSFLARSTKPRAHTPYPRERRLRQVGFGRETATSYEGPKTTFTARDDRLRDPGSRRGLVVRAPCAFTCEIFIRATRCTRGSADDLFDQLAIRERHRNAPEVLAGRDIRSRHDHNRSPRARPLAHRRFVPACRRTRCSPS